MEYDYTKLKIQIGDLIRLERKKLGYSQIKLAEFADIHYNYLGEIERGEKSPTFITIIKICFGLGIGLEDFTQSVNELLRQ